MHRIVIFGHSGAGKSTLARRLAAERTYENRTDEISLHSHRRLFESFAGPKREVG